jgi:alpha-glucosidase
MSTWGTGLFASDGAQDFLDDLAELEPADRLSVLEKEFGELLGNPSLLMRTVFPESLIAAAALVALSLPGGQRIMDAQNSFITETVAAAALDRPASELAPDALHVLAIVTAPESDWSRKWRRPDDREDALGDIEAVKAVLQAAQY